MPSWEVIAGGLVVAFCVSFVLTFMLSRMSFAMDLPNWRSQHTRPIPRSGGIAIVCGMLSPILFWLSTSGAPIQPQSDLVVLVVSGVFMCVVGLRDDCAGLSPWLKLGAQIAVAVAIVAHGASLQKIGLPGGDVLSLGIFGPALSVLWLLVCMNAVNFIDGADGLIAKSLVVGFAGVGGLALLVGLGDLALLALVLSASLWGFYWWNRPPARIFMGDSGSQFLGLMIGGLTLLSAPLVEQRLSLLVIPLVFLPILFDASFTVLRRAIAVRPVWRPHRTHLFQLALRAGMSSLSVSRVYLALTVLSMMCGFAMTVTLAPWHQLWVLPALIAQGLWVWRVMELRRAHGLPWHDD